MSRGARLQRVTDTRETMSCLIVVARPGVHQDDGGLVIEGMKRKRRSRANTTGSPSDASHPNAVDQSLKRRKLTNDTNDKHGTVDHPVLSAYYNRVCTLRQYLSEALDSTGASKHRKRALEKYKSAPSTKETRQAWSTEANSKTGGSDPAIACASPPPVDLLDHVRVGVCDAHAEAKPTENKHRGQDFEEFTQQMSASSGGTADRSNASGNHGSTMHEVGSLRFCKKP